MKNRKEAVKNIDNSISNDKEYSFVNHTDNDSESEQGDLILSSNLKQNSPIYDKQIIIKLANDASTGKIPQITHNQQMIVISEYLDKNSLWNFVTTCKNLYNYFSPKILLRDLKDGVYTDKKDKLIELAKEFSNDTDIISAIVKEEWSALEFASDRLKDNKQIVLNCNALQFASDRLRSDKEFALQLLEKRQFLFEYLSNNLKDDRDIVISALTNNWRNLQFVSDNLKDDLEIVFKAVQVSHVALYFASDRIKNDKKFLLTAIEQSNYVLEYAPENLRNDKEFLLAAAKQHIRALQFASDRLKNDKEFLLTVVKQDSRALEYASDELQNKLNNLENYIESLKDNENISQEEIYDLAYLLAIKIVGGKELPDYMKDVSTEIEKTMQQILINNGFKIEGKNIKISNSFSIDNSISNDKEYSFVNHTDNDSESEQGYVILSSNLKQNSPIYDKQIIIKFANDASTGGKFKGMKDEIVILVSKYLDRSNLEKFVMTCKNLYNYFSPKIFIIKKVLDPHTEKFMINFSNPSNGKMLFGDSLEDILKSSEINISENLDELKAIGEIEDKISGEIGNDYVE